MNEDSAMEQKTDRPTPNRDLVRKLGSLRDDLGAGAYSPKDLRVFVGLHGDPSDAKRVPGWLNHVLNPVPHERWQPDYTFSDLISLFVVRFLLKSGVQPKAIRDAEAHLRQAWGTARPFVSSEIKTDGRNVFFRDEVISGQIEAADMRGQQTMREMVKDRLKSVHYSDGTATYWTPMRNVVVDPRVQFGEPVIAGTRLLTELVADAAASLGRKETAERFSISPTAVSSAVNFERRRAAVPA
jgi:uncharacterized protein (DUF433 family)